MGVNNKLKFAFDFFFTDIMNHVEFMKWTMTLGKEDDVLLIAILERLCKSRPMESLPQPFYDDMANNSRRRSTKHRNIPKNPLNVAIAYSQLMNLRVHQYNVFEVAFLSGESTFLAYSAFGLELLFFGILLVYNTFKQVGIVDSSHDSFVPVVMVVVISTHLFWFLVRRHFLSCDTFIAAVTPVMTTKGRETMLVLNRLSNQVLGVCIMIFNVYFILVSTTPIDAVLNAVALGYIMDIDDVLTPPSWDEDTVEDQLAANVHEFIQKPFDPTLLTVVHREPLCKGVPYHRNDKWYVRLHQEPKDDKGVYRVTVFRSCNGEYDWEVTTQYESIQYEIRGPQAPAFFRALSKFRCLVNLADIYQ